MSTREPILADQVRPADASADGTHRPRWIAGAPARPPVATNEIEEHGQRLEATLARCRAAEDAARRYGELFQTCPDACIITGPDGSICEANATACLLLNGGAQILAGQPLTDVLGADQRDRLDEMRRSLIEAGDPAPVMMDFRLRSPGGAAITASVNARLAPSGDDQASDVCWVIKPISPRKRLEAGLALHRDRLEEMVARRTTELDIAQQRLRSSERMATLGSLTSGFGQEMGNVILPILCQLDALAGHGLPARAANELNHVRDAIIHLRRLSNGLTMLALDPDDPNASSSRTVIQTWWAEICPLLAKVLPRDAVLNVDIDEQLPPVAIAPHQLTHVLRHLLLNCAQALGRQGRVRLCCRTTVDDPLRVAIIVADNGRGMTEEVQAQALERFITSRGRSQAAGSGLPLVRAIVRASGGTVHIESHPGEGTAVTLRLPLAVDGPPAGRPAAGGRAARVTLQDARLASYVDRLLESAAIRSVHAAGPSDAAGVDEVLWISDCELGGGGREAITSFLSGRPDRRVVLITRSADEHWNQPGVVVVDGSHRAMHRALQSALLEFNNEESLP